MEDIQLPYGIKDGELLHIAQVESGLACGCVCPSCDERLVAKRGPDRQDHFAHYSGDSCPGALETALHLAAKGILEESRYITLPEVSVIFKSRFKSQKCKEPVKKVILKSKTVKIDSVRVEKKLEDIIPDLILEIQQRTLLIEVYVTNKVSKEKIHKIRELGISAIEIDLSSAPRDMPMKILSELIVHETDNKKWLNNERANIEYKKAIDKAIRKEVIRRGSSVYVKSCPKKIRKSNSKYMMRTDLGECIGCKYCIELQPYTGSIEYVYCIGHIQDAVAVF